MKLKRIISYFLALALFVIGVGYYFLFAKERLLAPSWNLEANSINMDGIERTFSYYVPENVSTSPSLLFLLHGSDGSSQLMRYLTNYEFEKQANRRNNVIVVYPQGFEKHWNDCRESATYRANTTDINDIGFFQEMVNYFEREYEIDGEKVFSLGYSNGGHMCFKLAFELPDMFTGIGVYSANIPEMANNDCSPKNIPISTIIVNGTDDPINPYDGGLVVLDGDSSRGSVLSSMETFEYFKNLLPDTCRSKERTNTAYSDLVAGMGTSCTHAKHQIELVRVQGGGHTIPLISPPPFLPSRIGKTETSVNSAELILDFFAGLNK